MKDLPICGYIYCLSRLLRRIICMLLVFRNPSLSADGTWTSTYWPLHTPIKREVLVLNAVANNTGILEGHRVKKCAFWKIFLPKLLSLGEWRWRPGRRVERKEGAR